MTHHPRWARALFVAAYLALCVSVGSAVRGESRELRLEWLAGTVVTGGAILLAALLTGDAARIAEVERIGTDRRHALTEDARMCWFEKWQGDLDWGQKMSPPDAFISTYIGDPTQRARVLKGPPS